jgi:hypothetical protein
MEKALSDLQIAGFLDSKNVGFIDIEPSKRGTAA